MRVSNINLSDLEGSQEYCDFLGKEKCASVGILYGDVQGSAQVFFAIISSYSPSRTVFPTFAMFLDQRNIYLINTFA